MAEKPLHPVVGEIGYIADRRGKPSQPSFNDFYNSVRGLSFTDKINLLQIMSHNAYDFVCIDSVEDLDRQLARKRLKLSSPIALQLIATFRQHAYPFVWFKFLICTLSKSVFLESFLRPKCQSLLEQ